MPRDSCHLPDILKQHLSVSWGVWRCLCVSVGVCWYVVFLGDATGLSGGCLGGVWVIFIEIGGARMCLGGMWVLSPYSMEQKHYLGTILKGINFVTWPYWGIEISKWSHISFPKMVGLCHFLWFLVSPEKNYSSQLLWITLYMVTSIKLLKNVKKQN